MITPEGEIITDGDKTNCEECGKEYIYFTWAPGSKRRYCRPCLKKGRAEHGFDCINDGDDPIDIDAEQDMIYNEIEERQRRDYPRDR